MHQLLILKYGQSFSTFKPLVLTLFINRMRPKRVDQKFTESDKTCTTFNGPLKTEI